MHKIQIWIHKGCLTEQEQKKQSWLLVFTKMTFKEKFLVYTLLLKATVKFPQASENGPSWLQSV